MAIRIDSHQHFWNLDQVEYPWLVPAFGPLYRTIEADELEPQLRDSGVEKTVIVQAMDSYADTAYMLDTAERYNWVGGVVGWVPLHRPAEAAERLAQYAKLPIFKGIRHLIHEEQDPDWVVQDTVIESLKVLADMNLTFDVVAVFPNHLKHIPTLAKRIPNLKMVIDHLAKPPLDQEALRQWERELAEAAQYPNVYAKISGLNTVMADPLNWTYLDLKPHVDKAIELFGANRCMFGSDWPVALLAGDYAKVWNETNRALADYSQAEIDAVLGGTAAAFYKIDVG
ncbi:amidohydrolase family protein [Paenibacillus sp. N1-5-1-14]|uniref:amidohydrolase family protein n=1 Tax=Paenibacillus radicibacter TaxID=2972488 RepID=UPI002158D131|nr:amidohydrolase family protein [Paenibacillus radicibacter]MCR8644029.1 amidohydrolase family protein [Paenibacillus radicibacter]